VTRRSRFSTWTSTLDPKALVPFFVGCAAIWWVSSQERPFLPASLGFRGSDKLLHFCAYALLASLASLRALRASDRPRAVVFEVLLLAGCYGVVDELHQSTVPGRDSSLGDVGADVLGAWFGGFLVERNRHRLRLKLTFLMRRAPVVSTTDAR
jgi:VanZ family protein